MRMLVTEDWLLWSPPHSKSSGSPNPVIDPACCSSHLARFCSQGYKHMPGINLVTTVTDFLREALKWTEPPSSSIALIMLTPCLKNLSCHLQTHSNSLAWYLSEVPQLGPYLFQSSTQLDTGARLYKHTTDAHSSVPELDLLCTVTHSHVPFTSSNSNFLQRAPHTPSPPQAFPATVIATTSELFQNILYCSSVTQHVLLYWNGHFVDMSSLLLRL